MSGRQTPCEMACSGVSSFVGVSFDLGTSCFDSGVEIGSVGIAEGAIVYGVSCGRGELEAYVLCEYCSESVRSEVAL